VNQNGKSEGRKLASRFLRCFMVGGAALLTMTGAVAAAGTASAVTRSRHVLTAPVMARHTAVMAAPAASVNYCNLPTSAGAGSGYAGNYADCYQCVYTATYNQYYGNGSHPIWYCTWAPATDSANLHYSNNTSGTCDLPTSAGPGSGYIESTSCHACTDIAASETQQYYEFGLGPPWVFYCTWSPSARHADLHDGYF
jgi:hypothetical protein